MLIIRRLRIEIKTANENRGGIYGFDRCFSEGLNFIASTENTSGKSSVIEAIYYCLGFEQIIGGKNKEVLTSVYKSQLKDGDKIWNVLESGAFLEVSNGKDIITIFRSAKMNGRDPRLVTVYYGEYDSISERKAISEDMYLHDGGSATNEKGFHTFLESFLNLQLPLVRTTGKDQKLYLQTIFSCIFIEQKHGWSDIFSGMPYLGIKESKKRVVEFLIGLENYNINREKEKLNLLKKSIEDDWKNTTNIIIQTVNRDNCVVIGIPTLPQIMTERDYSAVSILIKGNKDETIEDAISKLKKEHNELKNLKPRIIDNFDELNVELREIEETIASYEQKLLECQEQIRLSKSAIIQAERSLEIIIKDIKNNKDAAKLQRFGSKNGCQSFTNVCPICNQSIQDSLLHSGKDFPILSIDDNIRHLEGQKMILEFDRDSHKSNVDNLTRVQNDIRSRLIYLIRLAQAIRSDLYSTETEWSEAIIQKIVDIKSLLNRYEYLQNFLDQQLKQIIILSDNWKKYKCEIAKLPKNTISDSDYKRLEILKNHFVSNLKKYNYKSAPDIDAVEIPIDTCLPAIDGFDMKFDSSASDNIRIIWSYTMALLQTSLDMNGNHPGIIIFDEPAQHSIVTSDMESLIHSVLDLKSSAQVIIGITLNNTELKNKILGMPTDVANIITIDDLAFQLL